ncbi:MAG: hypothetical protein L3J98_09980 [Gammaproteobacteria bacterium]|nr:hypothetical protein [Gammaproteobacteria bacterium]MCF6260464.1 hypothetical protein [Gammaproteobacteria bacterium]
MFWCQSNATVKLAEHHPELTLAHHPLPERQIPIACASIKGQLTVSLPTIRRTHYARIYD